MNEILIVVFILCGLFLFVDGLLSILLQLDDLWIYQPGRVARAGIGIFFMTFCCNIYTMIVLMTIGITYSLILYDVITEYEDNKKIN